jgi:hypothetical protein
MPPMSFYTKIAKDAKPVQAHRSRLDSVIKSKNRACLAVSSVALAKDENWMRAENSLFAPFATLV